MKTTLGVLMASKPAIDNLAGQVMRSALIAYKVAKLIRRLNHEYESFDVARIAALKRLGTLSEDGTQYTLKNGEREQFEAEMAEVAANEVELNVPELSVEELDRAGAQMSAIHLLMLDWLFGAPAG